MTRIPLIVMLLALLAAFPARASDGDRSANATPLSGTPGYSITAAGESARQPDVVEEGSPGRDLFAEQLAQNVSTGIVVTLGIVGLVWVRRHVAAL